MTRVVETRKVWPGVEHYRAPRPLKVPGHLEDHPALIVHALALPGEERFGVGAYVVAEGELVTEAGVIVPDNLTEAECRQVERWALGHPVDTPRGLRPRRVLSLTDFCDSKGRSDGLGPMIRVGYWGHGWVIGYDLIRTLGLLAEEVWPVRGWADGYRLAFPGWTRQVEDKRGRLQRRWRSHRAPLRIRMVAARSIEANFSRAPSFGGQPTGEWEGPRGYRRPYRGRFRDLCALGFVLDGTADDSLDRRLALWGLDPIPRGPHHCALPDEAGAGLAAAIVDRLHTLALRTDEMARDWRLDLDALHSPAGVEGQLFQRMGVLAPLQKLALSDAEMGRWLETFRGGLVYVNPEWMGAVFEGTDVDLHSGYPTVCHLLGWWDHLTAASVTTRKVTAALRDFLTSPELGQQMKDPRTWRRWGLTRARVRLDRHPWPVGTTEKGADQLLYRPTSGLAQGTWLDAVAATLLTGRPVQVSEAVQIVPQGRQEGLKGTRIPGAVLRPERDPLLDLYATRGRAKAKGDQRTAAWLRVVLNGGPNYGQSAQIDGDRPGRWCWPPLAATVAAGCRCLLAMLGVEVEDKGGALTYCDTDGGILGGLDRDALAVVLQRFDGLSPWGGELWGLEDEGPVVVWRSKRYRFLSPKGSRTEHGIGALVPPPSMPGRDLASGHHEWLEAGTAALARHDGDVLVLPWEKADRKWPRLQRTVVARREDLRDYVAKCWPGGRPHVRLAQALAYGPESPAALDPGGDLTGWADLDWRDLRTGKPLRLTADPADAWTGAVVVFTLREELVGWTEPGDPDPEHVELDPRLVRLVGPGRGRYLDGSPQAALDDPTLRVLQMAAKASPTRLAGLTGLPLGTAKKLAAGNAPRSLTVKNALCKLGPQPLARLLDEVAERPCSRPGCSNHGRPRSPVCSEACKKALSRAKTATSTGLPSCCGRVFLGKVPLSCPECGKEIAA